MNIIFESRCSEALLFVWMDVDFVRYLAGKSNNSELFGFSVHKIELQVHCKDA